MADYRFTDHAASRCFEYGVDHQAVLDALIAAHFTQKSDAVDKREIHYVKVDGLHAKVITGPSFYSADETQAIISIVPLDVGT
jgi:CTP:phosphocholine cytidylyltransferase-like protein